ncbi:MAG: hypothetical protein Q9191_006791 [Dirinaria sp. TL-2023a]
MAARKVQQEIDKCFKKIAEGIQAFENIYDKIQQSNNASQKEKLEDALKREIKKLQRHRDQIKTWAAGNEVKDKKPLLEQRKAIENQMEKFKAVEKEMKTKAFSKEGLSAAAKLDPKEQEKAEAVQFLANMVEELDRQVETLEAEEDAINATVRKKKDTGKADRLGEITRLVERHKWHQAKLELLLRSLENGNVETEQVQEIEEGIKYYVEQNQDVDFNEDDTLYDDMNLEEDEGAFGIANDVDRVSSQDTQSVQDDQPDTSDGRGSSISGGKPKSGSVSEATGAAVRRPSNQSKSPLPALATLHTPLANIANGATNNAMKPAPLPTRAPGETLKYASAAAAAAASDKSAIGIAPLPPPPGAVASQASSTSAGLSAGSQAQGQKTSTTTSPSVAQSQPTSVGQTPAPKPAAGPDIVDNNHVPTKSPTLSQPKVASVPGKERAVAPSSPPAAVDDVAKSPSQTSPKPQYTVQKSSLPQSQAAQKTELSSQVPEAEQSTSDLQVKQAEDESVYHLPPGLQDLIQSFEATKSRATTTASPSTQRLLSASRATCPEFSDAERPRHYRPQTKYNTPRYYPQEPFMMIEDPSLYSKIDTDTLFYIFYYRQNTYQQYMAAKSLKSQSWRFHKQYQTWFQRHEEPKTITEEFEQGTYRFFDYESTWYAENFQRPSSCIRLNLLLEQC